MGGNAFSATLSALAFPRMPPPVYRALKARLTPRLKTFYAIVSTPIEAPEKADHGDLDLLVCEPLAGATTDVPHDDVQALLGAAHVVPAPGNRTSSYAVPIENGEWHSFGHAREEQEARSAAEAEDQHEIYYQVDVHVCEDKAEWERIDFFHGYGDLGMILGLLARNKGLTVGTKGLKLPNPPRQPVDLCESMDEIISYMGLSMQRWKEGFRTKQQVFEWVGTSTFFDVATFRTEGQGLSKVKPDRKMYAQFVEWVKEQKARLPIVPEEAAATRRALSREAQIQDALVFFGKKEEFDALVREDAAKARLKNGFNGKKVQEWTGLTQKEWRNLKLLMDEVRNTVGGEPGILRVLEEQGEDGLKTIVLRVKEELGIVVVKDADDAVEQAAKALEAVEITDESRTISGPVVVVV